MTAVRVWGSVSGTLGAERPPGAGGEAAARKVSCPRNTRPRNTPPPKKLPGFKGLTLARRKTL